MARTTLYETFIQVPSSLTWVLLKEPPSPVCQLRRPWPSPSARTPHHPSVCQSYHAPPLSLFHGLPPNLGRKFRILTTALFVFSSLLSYRLYSLLTLHPQSHWLGSVSPTEAWLPVTKRHLLKEALPVAPLRVAYLLRVYRHCYGAYLGLDPESLCVSRDSIHSSACLLAHPHHAFCIPGTQLSPGKTAQRDCLWLLLPWSAVCPGVCRWS